MSLLAGMNASSLSDAKVISTAISTLTANYETINIDTVVIINFNFNNQF